MRECSPGAAILILHRLRLCWFRYIVHTVQRVRGLVVARKLTSPLGKTRTQFSQSKALSIASSSARSVADDLMPESTIATSLLIMSVACASGRPLSLDRDERAQNLQLRSLEWLVMSVTWPDPAVITARTVRSKAYEWHTACLLRLPCVLS